MCVVDATERGRRSTWLRLENHRAFPYVLEPASGVDLRSWTEYDAKNLDDPLLLLERLAAGSTLGTGLLAGPGSTEADVSGVTGTTRVTLTPDGEGVVLKLVTGLLLVLPMVNDVDVAVRALVERVVAETVTKDGAEVSTAVVLAEVTRRLPLELLPGFGEVANGFVAVTTCVRGGWAALTEFTSAKLLDLARQCAQQALDIITKEAGSRVGHALLGALQGLSVPKTTIDFALHGKDAVIVTVTRPVEPGQGGAGTFEAFGLTRAPFGWSADDSSVHLSPPTGANRFSALWGVFDGARRCSARVEFDVNPDDPAATGNFGFAVAPISALTADQPSGTSVQYEQESPPDFAQVGTFLRPATLPSGAWSVELAPTPAPDIHRAHHVLVTDSGSSLTIYIDGRVKGSWTHPAAGCGGVSLRAWGTAFSFHNVKVTGA